MLQYFQYVQMIRLMEETKTLHFRLLTFVVKFNTIINGLK